MSQMVTEFYDAFISAGADEQKSKKAAEVIAEKDKELATKGDIYAVKEDVNGHIKSLKEFMYLGFGLLGAGILYLANLIYTVIDKF